MKKKSLVFLLVIISLASLLAGCSTGKVPEPFRVPDLTYSEEAFRAETASKSGKVLTLAEESSSDAKIYYYPVNSSEESAVDGASGMTADIYAEALTVNEERDDEELPALPGIADDLEFLQSTIRKMTGASEAFEIVTVSRSDFPSDPEKGIHIGAGADITDVKDDGYALKIDENGVFIAANNVDGLSNGIYCFLENELGCMFVRADFSYIPFLPTIRLPRTEKTDNPDFSWRRIYQYEVSSDLNWARRLKSNGSGVKLEYGDGNRYWGTWCHSVFRFVPPEEYFSEHPEYYAEIDGVRRYVDDSGVYTQLCLTNDEIYPIIHDNLKKFIAERPDAIYWDFSINDSQYVCECDECTAAYEKYGSHMGAMLEIVNRLAKDFPHKIISTLAYFHNNVVPKGIGAKSNVNIVIAPIETSQLYPFRGAGNAGAASAKKMIEEWSKVSDNLFIWDYVVNFKHLLLPYPNYSVQRENLLFYKEHNVKAVFHQGSREESDEQASIRSYLLARGLWDIDADIEAITGKYLRVTYGDAAEYIAEYLNLMHSSVAHADDLDLYDEPWYHYFDYLSPANLKKYDELTLLALKAVEGDTQKSLFVKEIRLNVLYARMTQGGLNTVDMRDAFNEFKTLLKEIPVSRPYETTPPDMEEFIEKTYPRTLALKSFVQAVVIILAVVVPVSVTALVVCRSKHPKPGKKQKPHTPGNQSE